MKKTSIDLFAGAGGFTTGATQAGLQVLWAANHDPLAVGVHEENHPSTVMACQDLEQANWELVPGHDILLASPACQGNSRARGRAGREGKRVDALRSTAWAVISCAEFHEPKAIIVENVPEFLTAWRLYPAWELALKCLGYQVSVQVLNAADFGVPQARGRVFIVASKRKKIELVSPKLAHVAASEIISWNSGDWSEILKPGRAAATLAQVAAGRKRYGDRFLIAYYGNDKAGRDPSRPLGTVTTKDRHAVICGDKMRMLTVEEYRLAMGFPSGYKLGRTKAESIHLLGNAVCPPVARAVCEQVKAAV